jgi:putative transposase
MDGSKETNKFKLDRRTFKILENEPVEYKSEVYKVTQLIDFKQVTGVNVKTGDIKILPIEDLKPAVPDEIFDNGYLSRDISDIADSDWEKIEFRYRCIEPLIHKDITRKEAEVYAKEKGVHFTTLYRWLRQYQSTGTLTGLLSKKRGRREGDTQISHKAEKIIQETIEKYYLTRQKHSIRFVIDKVIAQCMEKNIKPPSKNTIRNRVNIIASYEKEARRVSASIARDKYGATPGQYSAQYPLHVVQIDHTQVDIILVDDVTRKPIGRPWLTLMIDIYSRMITGYYLSLDAPSSTSVAMCITNSVLPKDELLIKHDIDDAEWNVWGFMHTLHADNGADFRADALRRACQLRNINLEFRPIGKKHFGGHIERLIGTTMKHVHSLPGTTFSNIESRKTYDSDGNASMTFDEFEKWLLTFITKYYIHKKHSTIEMKPITKWNKGIFGDSINQGVSYPFKPSDPLSVLIDFLPIIQRTVQRNGVNIDGINYYDNALRPYVNQIDPKTNKKKVFTFKRDSRDISYIWFYDDNTKEALKIRAANAAMPSMSLTEYKAIRKSINDDENSIVTDAEIIRAHEEMHKIAEESVKTSKKTRRAQQKARNYKKDGVLPQVTYKKQPPVEPDMDGSDLWDDDVPNFDEE